jgi:hypothetical protein
MATERYVLAIDLSPAELACRLCEAAGQDRPTGMTAIEALAHVDLELREVALRAANIACEYFNERMKVAAEQSGADEFSVIASHPNAH